ncbi:hypothetical protein GQ53DRAFT_891078, partial [Thozetella sp. PMI_491]
LICSTNHPTATKSALEAAQGSDSSTSEQNLTFNLLPHSSSTQSTHPDFGAILDTADMEAIAAGSSVVAFLQLAETVITVCSQIVGTMKDAPRDILIINAEVESLKNILLGLQNTSAIALSAPNGPIALGHDCLESLRKLLPAEGDLQELTSSANVKTFFARLAWPLKEPKARRLLAEMAQHKATMLLSLAGDVAINALQQGVHQLQDSLSTEQRRQVISWLQTTTSPIQKHQNSLALHEPHTSEWILRLEDWKKWLDQSSSDRFLWIHGIPGAGKTVLASFLIKQCETKCKTSARSFCAYYYCLFSNNQVEAVPFLRWIIAQMCGQALFVPEVLLRFFNRGSDLPLDSLLDALEELLQCFESVYVVLDAADETKERHELLRVVGTLVTHNRFSKLRLLATSREYLDIELVFRGLSLDISMSNPEVAKDIRTAVHKKLRSNRKLQRWAKMFQEIEEAMVEGAQGM